MDGLYNQSTLKRMKKDDLVQLYLDLQAKHINLHMENEERIISMHKYRIMEHRYSTIVDKLETKIDKLKNQS